MRKEGIPRMNLGSALSRLLVTVPFFLVALVLLAFFSDPLYPPGIPADAVADPVLDPPPTRNASFAPEAVSSNASGTPRYHARNKIDP